ncbi:hypothetical protein KI387_028809, partial [Taxus chinensis]
RLANDMLHIKKQISQAGNATPSRLVPTRTFNGQNQNQNRNRLAATPQRLTIEAAPRNNLETNEEDLSIDESFDDEDFIDPA